MNIVKGWIAGGVVLWVLSSLSPAHARSDRARYLDGETVREYVASFAGANPEKGDGKFTKVLEHFLKALQHVWLDSLEDGLHVEVFLSRSIDYDFQDKDETENGKIYGFSVPKEFEIVIRGTDGQLDATNLESITLKAKLPFLPDNVELSSAELGLGSREYTVVAYAVWGQAKVVQKGQLGGKSKIDWGRTLRANSDPLAFLTRFIMGWKKAFSQKGFRPVEELDAGPRAESVTSPGEQLRP